MRMHRSMVIVLTILGLGLFSTSCKSLSKLTIEKPDHLISLQQAQILIRNYREHRIPAIKTYEVEQREFVGVFKPTENGWCSAVFLRDYFNYIEFYAALAKVKISGYKIAFGNYPRTDTYPKGEIVHFPRQNTFIMYPTILVGDKEYGIQFRRTTEGIKPLRFVDMPSTPGGTIPPHEIIPTIANEANLNPPPEPDDGGELNEPPGQPAGGFGNDGGS